MTKKTKDGIEQEFMQLLESVEESLKEEICSNKSGQKVTKVSKQELKEKLREKQRLFSEQRKRKLEQDNAIAMVLMRNYYETLSPEKKREFNLEVLEQFKKLDDFPCA